MLDLELVKVEIKMATGATRIPRQKTVFRSRGPLVTSILVTTCAMFNSLLVDSKGPSGEDRVPSLMIISLLALERDFE